MLRYALILAVLLGCLPLLAADRPAAPPAELRAAWLIPNVITPETRDATFDTLERMRINTVFLLTPKLGENRGSGNDADFGAALAELKKRGVSVHAWVMNKWRTGDQADFADPAERAAQAAWALAVLDRWPALDGFHLDYIRYSEWAKPDAKKREAVTATVRAIREAMRGKRPKAKLSAAVYTADFSYLGGRWGEGGAVQWDGDVPPWFAEWHAADAKNVYVTRPAAEHAAGRFADHDPKHVYGPIFLHMQQDPVAWLREDLVDLVISMQYCFDRDRWRFEADTWKQFVGDKHIARVGLGLGWLTEKGHPDWNYDAPAMAHHAEYAQQVGLAGCSIYALGVPGIDDKPLIKSLAGEDGPWREPSPSPLRQP